MGDKEKKKHKSKDKDGSKRKRESGAGADADDRHPPAAATPAASHHKDKKKKHSSDSLVAGTPDPSSKTKSRKSTAADGGGGGSRCAPLRASWQTTLGLHPAPHGAAACFCPILCCLPRTGAAVGPHLPPLLPTRATPPQQSGAAAGTRMPAAPSFEPLRDGDKTLAAFRGAKPPGGDDYRQPCWPLEGTAPAPKRPLAPLQRVLEGKAELWVLQLPAQVRTCHSNKGGHAQHTLHAAFPYSHKTTAAGLHRALTNIRAHPSSPAGGRRPERLRAAR